MIEDLKKVGIQSIEDLDPFIIDNNPDGLDEETLAKVNTLREERDAYNKKASDIQKEIDKAILEFNNFPGLEGKYLKIEYADTPYITTYCGPVYQVDRIYSKSCRVLVKKLIQIITYEANNVSIKLLTNDEIVISKADSEKFHRRKTNYEEISKETFDNILDEEILKFKQNK